MFSTQILKEFIKNSLLEILKINYLSTMILLLTMKMGQFIFLENRMKIIQENPKRGTEKRIIILS